MLFLSRFIKSETTDFLSHHFIVKIFKHIEKLKQAFEHLIFAIQIQELQIFCCLFLIYF